MEKWLFCADSRSPIRIKSQAFRKSVRITTALLLLISFNLQAQTGGEAGTLFYFNAGARAYGMGGTALAITDDPSAIFVNPGMLGIQTEVQLNATLSRLKFDRKYYDFSFVYPYGNLGSFGIGWTQLGVDNIPGRDQSGYITQNFSDLQSAFTLSYAHMIGDVFSLGVSGKFLSHSLAGSVAKGNGFDIGMALYLGDYITIGGAIKNIGTSVTWNTDSKLEETFPTQIGLGAAYYDPLGFKGLLLAGDFNLIGGKDMTYGIGTEYVFRDLLIARAGFCKEGLTFGGGIMYGAFKLDCGYTPEKFSSGARLHFTINWLISSGEAAAAAPAPATYTPPPATAVPARQAPSASKRLVVITDGPLKSEEAEVIRIDEVNRTVTVRLVALPGSEPITLNLNQVKFVE